MDWQFVSVSAVAEAASGNLTLNAPASAAKGDLLIACIGYRDSAAFTPPVGAGWNLVATQQSSGDTDATSGIASGGMWYLVRGVSNPSFAFTRTAGDVAEGVVLCYRNCTATPYDTGGAATLGSLGEPSLSAISTAEANELLVAMVVSGDNNTVNTFDAATAPSVASGTTPDTTTQPTSDTWILRFVVTDTTGADIGVALADGVKAGTGSTGTFSAIDQTATTRSVFIVGAFKQLPTVQPSVYDSVTTDSVNQTIDISEPALPTPSPNVYDSVGVEDELGTEVDNENLAGINIFDGITVTDVPSGAATLKDIDVFDSITVTESSSTIFDLAYFVYDEVTITEYSPAYVSELEKIIEDLEIFLSTSISPYDQVTVTEFITAKIDAETSIFDTVTVSESVVLVNTLSGINVNDLVGVTEDRTVRLSDLTPSVSDQVTTAESVTISNLILYGSMYDEITVAEDIDVYSLSENIFVDIYDAVGITEYVLTSVSGPAISVSDSISISESISSELPISTLVFDTVTVTEYKLVSLSDTQAITFDTVSINESATGAISLANVSVSDSIVLTENITVALSALASNVFDSVTVAESATSKLTDLAGINVFDATSIEDIPTVVPEGAIVHLNISGIYDLVGVTEQVTLRPSLAKSVYDSITVSESVQLYIGINSVVYDSITITENVSSSVNVAGINVYDSINLTDIPAVQVGAALLPVTISDVYETVTISESVTASIPTLSSTVYNTVSITELVEVAPDIVLSVNDIVTVSEQVFILSPVEISIFDASGISESVSVILDYGVNVSDVVNVRELVSGVGGELSGSVFDTVSISDWGYIYWLLAAGRLEVYCEGLGISVDTLGFMDRIGVDGIEIDIEALGI